MTVESATYISQLNTAYPAAGDNISEGDDHVRLVKSVLKSQFPNLATTAVSQTSAQMNKLGFETGSIIMFASGTTPTTETISGVKDWLLCDGGVHSNTTYAAHIPIGVGTGFVLGTAQTKAIGTESTTLSYQPINFLIKT
jgi:hypothetical protein